MERALSWIGKSYRKAGGDFFTIKAGKNRLIGTSLFLSEINGLQEKKTKRLHLKVNKSFAQYEGVMTIDGQLYVFLSDRTKEQKSIYIQPYSQELLPEGEPTLIGAYDLERRKNHKGDFKVVQSEKWRIFCSSLECSG